MKKFRVTVNGQAYDVEVEELKGGGTPVSSPSSVAVAPVAKQAPEKMPVSGSGSVAIEAPMQGKIVAVKVGLNDTVKDGDVVAVLEAMKMENEIVASSSGTVASVNVAAGQSVEAGDIIITLN